MMNGEAIEVTDRFRRRPIELRREIALRRLIVAILAITCGQALAQGASIPNDNINFLGASLVLRSDNGPEFVSRAILQSILENKIGPALIDPGKPWQIGTD